MPTPKVNSWLVDGNSPSTGTADAGVASVESFRRHIVHYIPDECL
jgi:hypothetical protein